MTLKELNDAFDRVAKLCEQIRVDGEAVCCPEYMPYLEACLSDTLSWFSDVGLYIDLKGDGILPSS